MELRNNDMLIEKRINNPKIRKMMRIHTRGHYQSEGDFEVELEHITVTERMKLKELRWNREQASKELRSFEEAIRDRILSELGISKRANPDIEFIGGKAIVRYWVSKKERSAKKGITKKEIK